MRLWETYFRTWNRIANALTIAKSTQDDDCATNYYGYLCDRDVCVKDGEGFHTV